MIRDVSEQPSVFLVLIFPDSSEERWARKRPRRGSQIRSSRGTKWRVEEVMQSGIVVYTVHCGPLPHGAQDLAADLLDRARKSVSPLEWRGRRR
jgi:hypothetical protein